jgi:hypothetical protein
MTALITGSYIDNLIDRNRNVAELEIAQTKSGNEQHPVILRGGLDKTVCHKKGHPKAAFYVTFCIVINDSKVVSPRRFELLLPP